MERQANYEETREERCMWKPSPALIEAIQQKRVSVDFNWEE
jgi:hypothetical protein